MDRQKWNIEGKIQGKTDVLLNEDGMEQAGFLAKAMEHCGGSGTLSSPLLRAKQTAEIVAGENGTACNCLPELKEVDFGLWEGCTWKEIEEKYPDDYRRWEMNPAAAARREEKAGCPAARERSAVERVLRGYGGRQCGNRSPRRHPCLSPSTTFSETRKKSVRLLSGMPVSRS